MEINKMNKEELNKFIKEAHKRLCELRKPEFDADINKKRQERLDKHYKECKPEDICCDNCESSPQNCNCLSCNAICGNCQEILDGNCREEYAKLKDKSPSGQE